ncbi:hypothetical protein HY628_01620 [Candidatus Uhrbacteria bacterium]|nr:hypothetical protein [Candidatus Uhrbacteria bacterium]
MVEIQLFAQKLATFWSTLSNVQKERLRRVLITLDCGDQSSALQGQRIEAILLEFSQVFSPEQRIAVQALLELLGIVIVPPAAPEPAKTLIRCKACGKPVLQASGELRRFYCDTHGHFCAEEGCISFIPRMFTYCPKHRPEEPAQHLAR